MFCCCWWWWSSSWFCFVCLFFVLFVCLFVSVTDRIIVQKSTSLFYWSRMCLLLTARAKNDDEFVSAFSVYSKNKKNLMLLHHRPVLRRLFRIIHNVKSMLVTVIRRLRKFSSCTSLQCSGVCLKGKMPLAFSQHRCILSNETLVIPRSVLTAVPRFIWLNTPLLSLSSGCRQ